MKLDVDYKLIGTIPEELTQEILSVIQPEHYFYNTIRSTMGNLEQTQSVILRYFDDYTAASSFDYKKHFADTELMPLYSKQVNALLNELKKYYNFSDYICFIAKLIPYGKVGAHCDNAPFLNECHRIHVPLQTNADVYYIIDGQKYNWLKNNIYEFDNSRLHSVQNNSGEDRIHFMFNLYE